MCLADDYESDNEEIFVEESFVDDRNQYEYIDKKIEDDLKDETGIVSSELEEKLNLQGCFDEDIEMLSDEEIECLEDTDFSDCIVYAEYYAVTDCEDKEQIVEDDMIPLTSNEVDMLIESHYYGKENDLDSVVSERVNSEDEDYESSIIDKTMEAIGLKPKNVYAENAKSIGGINDKKHYSYLKKMYYFNKTKYYYHDSRGEKNYYYQLIGTMTWTKMPDNRLLDVYQLSWNGLSYEFPSVSEKEDWRKQGVDLSPTVVRAYDKESFYVEKDGDGSQKGYSMIRHIRKKQTCIGVYSNGKVDLKNGQFIKNQNGISGAYDLINDRSTSTDSKIYYKNYYNDSIKITVYLKDTVKNTAVIYQDYVHAKLKARLKEGVVTSIAISVIEKDWKAISLLSCIYRRYVEYTPAGIGTYNGWLVML